MTFEEYLKNKKIKIKRDNRKCKLEDTLLPYFSGQKKLVFNSITNENMHRLRVMERYLVRYCDVEQPEFMAELREKPKLKPYLDIVMKYPYKNLIVAGLRAGSDRFAIDIEKNMMSEPKKGKAKPANVRLRGI